MQKQNIKVKRKIKIQAELKGLKKELVKVRLEKGILEKCARCLQASTQVKFEFIDKHISCFPIKDMCRILGVRLLRS